MPAPTPLPPLPTIELPTEPIIAEWPRPPYACDDSQVSGAPGAQLVRIESLNGAAVSGELVGFDRIARVLRFRAGPDDDPLELVFAQLRRLTLTAPWHLKAPSQHEPLERVSPASHERTWQATLANGGTVSGDTLGFEKRAEGWYFYEPSPQGDAVRPQFVPAAACRSMTLGPSVAERAAERWIGTREELLRALDAQRHVPIRSVGEVLLELGFVTQGQLERALRNDAGDSAHPLGERLVAAGVIDRADLQTALAFKMGTPMVDLSRFPMEAGAAGQLPLATLREHRALPLMRDGRRLVVAVDDLGRVPALQALSTAANTQIVPVLAPQSHLALALRGMPQRTGADVWAENVRLK